MSAEHASSIADYRKIPLTRGKFALVDDADYERVVNYKWRLAPRSRCFYAAGRKRGSSKSEYMHRVILEPRDGLLVDHINGDGLDNRRQNLRSCTPAQSVRNVGSLGGRSRYRGVAAVFGDIEKPRSAWRWGARIRENGVYRWLGQFRTQKEAAQAYDAAALRICGEFARLNFPRRGGRSARVAS